MNDLMTQMSQAMRVLTSQTTVEWHTPPHVIVWVKDILGGIALDPASCTSANAMVGAREYYSAAGLEKPWFGRTVFCNPPFTKTPKWVDKMGAEYRGGRFQEGILLVNSAPGYRWFERVWRERTVCCLRERLRFVKPDGTQGGSAKKGQTLVYFGPDDSLFADVLNPHGRIFRPSDSDAGVAA